MAVTITEATRIGRTTWRLSWTSSLESPTFYIYLDGVLADQTEAQTRQFEIAPGEQVDIQIFDSSSDTPEASYPGRVTLGWEWVDGAVAYRIQRWTGSAWEDYATVADAGQAAFTAQTPYLDDVTTHQFRIIAEDFQGLQGSAKEATVFMVRRPDQPSATVAYDDGTHVITAEVA